VKTAYKLEGVVPRKISLGLLNAIPETRALTPPDIPAAAKSWQLAGAQLGDVVKVQLSEDQFFLLLPQGKQRVPKAVADLIRLAHDAKEEFARAAPEDITRVPDAPASSRLDFSAFPAQAPQILDASASRNTCLVWPGTGQPPVVTTSADRQLPLGQGHNPVDVPGGGNGLIADRAFVESNKGALVRGVVPGQRADQGAIWLVTYQGVRYGVPSIEVARALGLGDVTSPAPESILGLLPIGPELDPQRALELFDPTLARAQQGTR
jgi:type VII secretion protein EccB